tara:strand:+ start:10509 stop:10775 length:267 start_codon:yes stop_codon:yes gene_type:complete
VNYPATSLRSEHGVFSAALDKLTDCADILMLVNITFDVEKSPFRNIFENEKNISVFAYIVFLLHFWYFVGSFRHTCRNDEAILPILKT